MGHNLGFYRQFWKNFPCRESQVLRFRFWGLGFGVEGSGKLSIRARLGDGKVWGLGF